MSPGKPTEARKSPSSPETEEGLVFEFLNGEATLVRSRSKRPLIKIPGTVKGFPVTRIGKEAFWASDAIAIEVPDSVRSIGESAFTFCGALSEISISGPVARVENKMCYSCKSLKSIELPDTVTSIGKEAFSGCDTLASVTIPRSVTTIEEAAFSHCKRLYSVAMKGSVTTIGPWAFAFCDSLTNVELPRTLRCL